MTSNMIVNLKGEEVIHLSLSMNSTAVASIDYLTLLRFTKIATAKPLAGLWSN